MSYPIAEAHLDGLWHGQRVLDGSSTAEQAGDRWLQWANASHAAGEAFLDAFDSTGAER